MAPAPVAIPVTAPAPLVAQPVRRELAQEVTPKVDNFQLHGALFE